MRVVELLEVLAASGLADDDYTRAVTLIRGLAVYAEVGTELAEVVLANECYQPAAVMAAVGRFYLSSTLADAA